MAREKEQRMIMFRRISSILSLVGLSIVCVPVVHSLSCAAPEMDKSIVQQAELIAEGWASHMRDLNENEIARLQKENIAVKGGDLSDYKAFELRITKAYKGAKHGDRITIYRNIYWGDTLPSDEPFFVLILDKLAGLNVAPLCGHTMQLRYAKEQGLLSKLRKILAEQ